MFIIKVISGNLLDVEKGILAHQVNCFSVMGSGVALAIKNKWIKVFDEYCEFSEQYSNKQDLLGKTNIVEIDEDDLYVANCFGQFGMHFGKVATQYDKLYKSLESTVEFAKEKELNVYVPFLIGCGSAGGDIEIVVQIILNLEKKFDIEITAVKLDKSNEVIL